MYKFPPRGDGSWEETNDIIATMKLLHGDVLNVECELDG